MSRTTLKVVHPDGEVGSREEYGNSWGFAAYIWDKMSIRYLGAQGAGSWMLGDPEPLWALAKDEHVPIGHRRVLRTTFDRAIIAPGAWEQVAADYRQFVCEFYDGSARPVTCHLGLIAAALEKLPPELRGACFYPMSVSQDLWIVREGDRERHYNIDRDKGHFFIEL